MNKAGVLRTVFLVLAMGAAAQFLRAQTDLTPAQVAEKVEQNFKMMDDIVVKFRQHVKFGLSKAEQQFDGTLTMRKPKKMRVEYEHQTIVTDGVTLWSYSPVNKQVLIDKYKEDRNSISPEHFLVSMPKNYYTALLGRETSQGEKTAVLKLVPKDEQSLVKSVKIWITEGQWRVRKVEIQDLNEVETTYTILSIDINKGVTDALFTFTAPEGVETIDLR